METAKITEETRGLSKICKASSWFLGFAMLSTTIGMNIGAYTFTKDILQNKTSNEINQVERGIRNGSPFMYHLTWPGKQIAYLVNGLYGDQK